MAKNGKQVVNVLGLPNFTVANPAHQVSTLTVIS